MNNVKNLITMFVKFLKLKRKQPASGTKHNFNPRLIV